MNNPCLLSEDEEKQAKEVKERTLRLLSDALKKKESLLVEDPKEFGDQKMEDDYCPLITIDLVKDLIQELEKVTFAKNTNPEDDIRVNAYVYPRSEDRTIYLCALFWQKDPESQSRQGTIIHEVSHFLGYGHTVQENSDRVQKSPQSMLCPLDCYKVALAFTYNMDHPGTYRDGSYSCCGETSRDTVCEKAWMAEKLRSMRQDYGVNTEDYMLKTQYHLVKTQDYLVKTQNYLVKTQNYLVKTQDYLEKTQDYLEKTQGDLEKTQDYLEKTQGVLEKTQDYFVKPPDYLVKTQITLFNVTTTLFNVKTTLLNVKTTLLNMQTNTVKGRWSQ